MITRIIASLSGRVETTKRHIETMKRHNETINDDEPMLSVMNRTRETPSRTGHSNESNSENNDSTRSIGVPKR